MSEETNETPAVPAVAADERKGKPSASGMHRLRLCPASWRAEKLYPQEETSADAAMGTRLHKHMEDGTLPEKPEEREAVEWCRQQEERIAKEMLKGDGMVKIIREQRLWDKDNTFSCKADLMTIRGTSAVITDYKFGRLAVSEPEENMQLICAAITAFDHLAAVQTVYCCILAPFVSRKDAPLVRYERKDVEAMRKYVAGVIAKAYAADAPARPSEDACRYCKAKAACPACTLMVQRVTAADIVANWSNLTIAERRKMFDVAKLAEKWAASVLSKVKGDLKKGVAYDGLSLAPGAKQFAVTDAAAAFEKLAAEYGITADEFVKCCKVNISDVDSLMYAKKNDGKGKNDPERIKQDDIKAMVRETLAECGKYTQKDASIKQ